MPTREAQCEGEQDERYRSRRPENGRDIGPESLDRSSLRASRVTITSFRSRRIASIARNIPAPPSATNPVRQE